MFERVRLWHLRRTYRPGRILSHFLARDIRRDVEVIDAARITEGVITVRVRTWNVLYAIRGLVPEPPFKPARETLIRDLWKWTGESWGGPVPESEL